MVQLFKLKIKTKDSTNTPLVDIAFDITTSTALIGESGSGKSITIKALLDMLPSNLEIDIDYKSDFLLTKNNIRIVIICFIKIGFQISFQNLFFLPLLKSHNTLLDFFLPLFSISFV